jgi:hypothetical protein
MKFASFFFTVLISSFTLAIGVYGDDDIIAPPPAIADADKRILAAATAASIFNDDIDHPHYHDLRDQPKEAVVSPPQPLRLGRKKSSSVTTITITTYKNDPYTYYGMPTTLKAGTYIFKYVNYSSVYYSFRIHAGDGWYATPLCAYCTSSVMLQVKTYYNLNTGEWEPWVLYFFYPHSDYVEAVEITA